MTNFELAVHILNALRSQDKSYLNLYWYDLNSAFHWRSTDEGHIFWNNIFMSQKVPTIGPFITKSLKNHQFIDLSLLI